MKHCPDNEELSAWLDGENKNSDYQTHVDTCAECSHVVAQYRQMAKLLDENYIPMTVPAGLKASVIEAVEADCMNDEVGRGTNDGIIMFTRYALRAVSILVIAGLIYVNLKPDTESPTVIAEKANKETNNTVLVSSQEADQGQNVEIDLVSIAQAPTTLNTLPTSFEHVWHYSGDASIFLDEFSAKIKSIYPEVSLEKSYSDDFSVQIINIELADKDLLSLIKSLDKNENLSLLSNSGPQPEKLDQYQLEGKKLKYQIKIVQD